MSMGAIYKKGYPYEEIGIADYRLSTNVSEMAVLEGLFATFSTIALLHLKILK
ncbi:MAG: hypothetical protein HYT34_02320 [Candidatus Ryanbacteria bacterium]|nr:hypothetical protein [Candidatus Ryanbacteria bacterium]